MKKLKLFTLLLFASIYSIYSQPERIENRLMECWYNSYDDELKARQSIINYENFLVKEGVLEDNSANSYMSFLQNFAERNESIKMPSKLFYLEVQKLKRLNIKKYEECHKMVLIDTLDYDLSKLLAVGEAISSDNRPHIIARDILKVLSHDDLEIDYYKLRTFLLLSIIDTQAGLSKSTIDKSKLDITNALKIEINSESEIYVKDKKVTLTVLKKLIRNYQMKNKSKSVISLKSDRKTLYSVYIKVQEAILEEIRGLREKLAKEKYNTQLDKLTKKQMAEIEVIYPQAFVEYYF